jgi:hypothetical protein
LFQSDAGYWMLDAGCVGMGIFISLTSDLGSHFFNINIYYFHPDSRYQFFIKIQGRKEIKFESYVIIE